MTIAEVVKQIVAELYPDATFLLNSQFEADYKSYFANSKPLIVLNNQLDEDDTINKNINITSRQKVQISVYLLDTFDDDERSNDLVVQAKEISKRIYLKLWLNPIIKGNSSDARITHRPFFRQLNSTRSGVLSLSNWSVDELYQCDPSQTYTLTTIGDTGGTVDPIFIDEPFIVNTPVPLYALAFNGYDFDYWEINTNGVITTSDVNPIITTIINNIVQTAKFLSSLVAIQNVFGTIPIDQVFADQSTGGNDVTYGNVQVAKLNGTSSYLPITNITTYLNDEEFAIVIFTDIISSLTGFIVNSGGNDASEGGFYFRIENDSTARLSIADGSTRDTSVFNLPANTFEIGNSYKIIVNGSLTNKQIYVDKVLMSNLNISLSGSIIGNPNTPNIGSLRGLNTFYGNLLSRVFIYNKNLDQQAVNDVSDGLCPYPSNLILGYTFQSGDDDFESDISGNGNNGQVINAILADFRGTRKDGIDSVLILNGHDVFQQIADDTKFIYAARDINGDATLLSKTGYDYIGYVPKNVISDNKILYDGVLGGVPLAGATFTEINALEDSATIDITKRLIEPLNVSNLIVKA